MLKIDVKGGDIEQALKMLKRKVRNIKQNEDVRDNRYYTKPSVENRAEKIKAEYIQQKNNEDF